MYRQIFQSTVGNLTITIPQNWYGQQIEVIAFPVNETLNATDSPALISDRIAENRKKREEMNRQYSMDLSNFKFNRDEANDYE
jgi:hypothetical protein